MSPHKGDSRALGVERALTDGKAISRHYTKTLRLGVIMDILGNKFLNFYRRRVDRAVINADIIQLYIFHIVPGCKPPQRRGR